MSVSDSDSELELLLTTTSTRELLSVKERDCMFSRKLLSGKTLSRWFMDQSKSIILDKISAQDLLRKALIIGEMHDAYT